jgi:hypothetical protein
VGQAKAVTAEASGQPESLIWTSRNGTRPQELVHHALTRREVEREKPRRLADSDAEIGCALEFLSNALNEFAKEKWWHGNSR